jgi:hypothetical protein
VKRRQVAGGGEVGKRYTSGVKKRGTLTDPRRNRRITVFLVAGILILTVAGLVFIGYPAFQGLRRRHWSRSATSEDALVLSMTLRKFFRENPQAKPEAIEAFMLQSASAAGCDLRVDPAGRPVDWFGTPFRVERERIGMEWVVTVTSAGPDRVFGTPDDIQRISGP